MKHPFRLDPAREVMLRWHGLTPGMRAIVDAYAAAKAAADLPDLHEDDAVQTNAPGDEANRRRVIEVLT